MDSRTNAVIEECARVAASFNCNSPLCRSPACAAAGKVADEIRDLIRNPTAAIDAAATPPAPLPDDVRRDVEDVRMAINRLFTDSDAGSYDCAVALDARHALDRIAARLNANGDSNDR